jgi:tetratricopeptide (TPR) repeat protein
MRLRIEGLIVTAGLVCGAPIAKAIPAAGCEPGSPATVQACAAAATQEIDRALHAWQLEDALARVQTALADAPGDAGVQRAAAEVLHQRGAHLQALALLPQASGSRRTHAAAEDLRAVLEASASFAPAFMYRDTAHFRIAYLDKDEVLATYAEAVLEAAYRRIGADLQFLPAERGEKIVVEIYPDAQGLAGATGLTVKEIETSGTIAVCKFHRLMITSPLATLEGYAWADTLAHEFTHLLVSKKSRNTIPIWLHEGIAKYFESRWRGAAGLALNPFGENLLRDAVKTNQFITLSQMHPSMALLPSQDDAALAFAEVFTLVQYIDQRFGTAAIARILQRCGEGVPLDTALSEVLHLTPPALEKAWKKSLLQRHFVDHPDAVPQRIRLRETQEGAPQKKPAETAQSLALHHAARLGELLQLRGHKQAASMAYTRALALGGSRSPTLVVSASRALVDLQHNDAALSLLRPLLRQQPYHTDANLLAGRLSFMQKDYAAAQSYFEAIRLTNPYNPELHMALQALYGRRGDTAAAHLEAHLLQLCQKARPVRHDSAYEAPTGEATVSVTSLPWGTVTLDGQPLQTPAWDTPVTAGTHLLAGHAADGHAITLKLSVGPGGHAVAVLR